ncbi:MAG: nucleoside triphosphate pyrophosphatase [Pseudomonadales bacterium]
MNLILASTSPYRAKLLENLRLPFQILDPQFDESCHVEQDPTDRCLRLAEGKARAAAGQSPQTPYLIIASDQVASLRGAILHKPGNFDRAFEQLAACRGQWVDFNTGLCLLSNEGFMLTRTEGFAIRFRNLTDTQITRYLNLEQPYDCAGSIKAESLGIVVLDDTRGRDLNTLLGLPLMLLTEMLAEAGIDVLNKIN